MPQPKASDIEKTLEFIEDYRSFDVLWDVNNQFYTKKKERKAAIDSLCEKHNMTEREIKNKIKCLRSYFAKEHQKYLDTGRTYWFAYEAMLFTLVKKRDYTKPYDEDEYYSDEEGASKTDEIEDENASAVEPILIQRSKRKRRIPEDSAVDVTILPRITSIESNGIRPSERFSRAKDFDEFDVFGQMVATQIRKFSRRNQAVAKNTIQNFLFDMEMREMDETPAPVQETVLQSLDPSSPPQITKHANTAEIDGIQQDM
ncbi:hypothetical protein JTE90_005731 [Oedothorax gibbosus]|uniref:MADF domain-containing protein n=1 Tax=Oedothorax gibbosus TaxID=931172 RepID=A0AAV6TZQ7_9ARAC|nr:hypothetical protein JTE90_005731 [Oedothorax gibbosus]